MTRRRWIADEVTGQRALLLGGNAEHLARVLRAAVGDEIEVSTGASVWLGRIAAIAPERVEIELQQELASAELARITLLLAIFKFDRMEWAVEKATELGVASIVPVITRRTDSHLAETAGKRVERWRRIVHEAAQQSRRMTPPAVPDPLPLRDALKSSSSAVCIVLAETERNKSLARVLADSASFDSIALAVGPEGGWTAHELDLFTNSGWTHASLGPTILRAETAAIAACAIVGSHAG